MKPTSARPDSALAPGGPRSCSATTTAVPAAELTYAVSLDADPHGARLARRLAVGQLALWNIDTPALSRALAIVTAELAANAVTHATVLVPWQFELRLLLGPDRLRLEVTDPRPDRRLPEQPGSPHPDATSGRGLLLVAAYADRWGSQADHAAVSKTVWAEFERGDTSRASTKSAPPVYPSRH